MKRNRKILLSLGSLAAVAAPVAAVVSCGSSLDNGDVTGKSTVDASDKTFADAQYEYKVLPTYTGQADQLLSLGIKPDRYPFQLDKSAPFAYITNPAEYMIGQSQDFKDKFAAKLASLMPEDRGTSWWNQQALDAGEKGSDPEYWQHRAGEFTMYEHYLLDDGAKVVETSIAPKHTAGSHSFVQTNFRESRDPFTRMPKEIMEGLLDAAPYAALASANDGDKKQQLVKDMLKAARFVEGVRDATDKIIPWQSSWDKATTPADFKAGALVANPASTALSVDGLPAPSGIPQQSVGDKDTNGYSWLYNDYFFAKSYHEDFLDNGEFQSSPVNQWIVNNDGGHSQHIFDKDPANDNALANLFFAATYTDHEKELADVAKEAYGTTPVTAPAAKPSTAAPHHPIYEQQEEIGGAPMFEGAQRDNMLYFFNTASRLTEAFTAPAADATQEEKDSYDSLVTNFHIGATDGSEDPRVKLMLGAQKTSETISTQLRARMDNIAKLVAKVKAANNGSLSFGLVTLAPGEGQTTLQTSSKYSFLYKELGFDQAMPKNLMEIASDPEHNVPADDASKTSFFNMDDNGWWWNLGEGTNVLTNAAQFKDSLDMGLLTANTTQFKNLKGNEKNAIDDMFKDKSEDRVDYNLWNEGLKTPFVMNMMLDKITDMLIKKGDALNVSAQEITEAEKTDAIAWGTYWTDTFVK